MILIYIYIYCLYPGPTEGQTCEPNASLTSTPPHSYANDHPAGLGMTSGKHIEFATYASNGLLFDTYEWYEDDKKEKGSWDLKNVGKMKFVKGLSREKRGNS